MGLHSYKPTIKQTDHLNSHIQHRDLGERYFQCSPSPNSCGREEDIEPEFLFTDNDTNFVDLWGSKSNKTPYVKDAFHKRVVKGDKKVVNPQKTGTKSCAWVRFQPEQGRGSR